MGMVFLKLQGMAEELGLPKMFIMNKAIHVPKPEKSMDRLI